MLKRQVLMFKNVFNATVWDNFQVFQFFVSDFFVSLPFLQVNKHHQTKFLIYQIGIYLVWHMHETKTSQSHSQTQILTKANIISKKPFLYIILYSFVFSFIASFRPRNIMKHSEAMRDEIITTTVNSMWCKHFRMWIVEKNLERICCPSYKLNADSWQGFNNIMHAMHEYQAK